jgi:hypothetical protein
MVRKLMNWFYDVVETIFVVIVVIGVLLESKWAKRKWNGK